MPAGQENNSRVPLHPSLESYSNYTEVTKKTKLRGMEKDQVNDQREKVVKRTNGMYEKAKQKRASCEKNELMIPEEKLTGEH